MARLLPNRKASSRGHRTPRTPSKWLMSQLRVPHTASSQTQRTGTRVVVLIRALLGHRAGGIEGLGDEVAGSEVGRFVGRCVICKGWI